MRLVYISPHLDDAVLSAGGLLFDRIKTGMDVQIWTVMAGLPGEQPLSEFGLRMHAAWGTTTPNETVRIRRGEDREAAAVIGAEVRYFDFVDCLYRNDSQGNALYQEALGVPIHPLDASLPALICEALKSALRDDDELLAQLGIGAHVDHLLARSALERLGRRLEYVADVPYVLDHPEELLPATASMQSHLEPVSDDGFHAWRAAVECYRSQLSTLFPSVEDLRERLRSYWEGCHGIRLWSLRERKPGWASPQQPDTGRE